jgi:hypothetical protein
MDISNNKDFSPMDLLGKSPGRRETSDDKFETGTCNL